MSDDFRSASMMVLLTDQLFSVTITVLVILQFSVSIIVIINCEIFFSNFDISVTVN